MYFLQYVTSLKENALSAEIEIYFNFLNQSLSPYNILAMLSCGPGTPFWTGYCLASQIHCQ